MKYQGLYATMDGRLGWFDISKELYLDYINGTFKGLCQDVRISV